MDSIATRRMGRIIDERLDNGLRVVIEPMHDVAARRRGSWLGPAAETSRLSGRA